MNENAFDLFNRNCYVENCEFLNQFYPFYHLSSESSKLRERDSIGGGEDTLFWWLHFLFLT